MFSWKLSVIRRFIDVFLEIIGNLDHAEYCRIIRRNILEILSLNWALSFPVNTNTRNKCILSFLAPILSVCLEWSSGNVQRLSRLTKNLSVHRGTQKNYMDNKTPLIEQLRSVTCTVMVDWLIDYWLV